jgi:hypothetical protein
MKAHDLLKMLNLGNSVAEFDEGLERYFVETAPFSALVQGRADIVAGDKGTGKTALYKILRRRYGLQPNLKDTEVLAGFNPSGNPVFQRLTQQEVLTEGQYISVWKVYLFALVGNWLVDLYEEEAGAAIVKLAKVLTLNELRTEDDSPQTVFSKLINLIRRVFTPKNAQVTMTVSEQGLPVIIPRVEFEDPGDGQKRVTESISHEDAFGILQDALAEAGLKVWVVLDRLDEAFQGHPETEVPALRALLRSYLDLLEFERVRLKLFVRRDLFRRIIGDGFVNLTHVNARKIEIVWDEEDLKSLLARRVRENSKFIQAMGLTNATDDELFHALFPAQVDEAERKPTTWRWLMARIRDGNDVKPPRNLIDLASKAIEAQLRREERSPRDIADGTPLIEAESVKKALSRLSSERVEDTLLAEAGDAAPLIEAFRGGKAEHNEATVAAKLGVPEEQVKSAAKPLIEVGFLEAVGESGYKVPMLYRDGLGITQGKAF